MHPSLEKLRKFFNLEHKNGYNDTAIIGGLIRDVQSDSKTGIPVLMDIPGLGWLFRTSNKTTAKRELIIFVTPKLIETAALSGQSLQEER